MNPSSNKKEILILVIEWRASWTLQI